MFQTFTGISNNVHLGSPAIRSVAVGITLIVSSAQCFSHDAQSRIIGGTKSVQGSGDYTAALLLKPRKLHLNGNMLETKLYKNSEANSIFDAEIVDCGSGLSKCENATGKLCLMERGVTDDNKKIDSCRQGGGVAALIYNNERPAFDGEFNEQQAFPVFSASAAVGQRLLNSVGEFISYQNRNSLDEAGFFCGGVYLGSGWVATAAHCVENQQADTLTVVLGGGDVFASDTPKNVRKIYSHKDYGKLENALSADIALLKLGGAAPIHPSIPLATEVQLLDAINAEDDGIAYGRGHQDVRLIGLGNAVAVDDLYEVSLPLKSDERCRNVMTAELIADDMLCAGSTISTDGTCNGDSGGPLVISVGGQDRLVGLVSWGLLGCGIPLTYNIFARTTAYNNALEAVMRGDSNRLGDYDIADVGGSNTDIDIDPEADTDADENTTAVDNTRPDIQTSTGTGSVDTEQQVDPEVSEANLQATDQEQSSMNESSGGGGAFGPSLGLLLIYLILRVSAAKRNSRVDSEGLRGWNGYV